VIRRVPSETITITSQGSGFVLDFDEKHDNGYNPRYSITTDMNGVAVKPIYANGANVDAEWRVTRQGPKKFTMELSTSFGGWKDEYEVSRDSTTMTMHRHLVPGRVVAMGREGQPVQDIFLFDKVK